MKAGIYAYPVQEISPYKKVKSIDTHSRQEKAYKLYPIGPHFSPPPPPTSLPSPAQK